MPSVSESVAGTVPPTVVVGAAAIAKSAWLTSKKTLPTASILKRAFAAVTFGMTNCCEPSFGVESAIMIGNVWPPSSDSVIFTFAALTGGCRCR